MTIANRGADNPNGRLECSIEPTEAMYADMKKVSRAEIKKKSLKIMILSQILAGSMS